MVTLSSDSRPIIGRGPPLGARCLFLAIMSITIMVLDQRGGYLETTRYWLGIAVNPIYSIVQAPFNFWNWLTGSFTDREQLRAENERLQAELRIARVKLLRFDALSQENNRLRAIRAASAGMGERTLIAEIISVDVDPFRHRVRINKGGKDGVFKGQPVLDAFGIVGQVTRVDRSTSEIILISDNEHAIPIRVNRNGISSIAVGVGDIHRLSLPFLTIESDVKPDDLLVSSGLDGIFPAGYPVAKIQKVERNPAETFAVVEAKPLAQLDRSREVLLLWVGEPAEEITAIPSQVTQPTTPAATSPKPVAKPEQKPERKPEQAPARKPVERPAAESAPPKPVQAPPAEPARAIEAPRVEEPSAAQPAQPPVETPSNTPADAPEETPAPAAEQPSEGA